MEGDQHDYTGVGINPMYQSSGTIATQDSGTQYDEIKTRPRQIFHKPPERVTTSNSLYASTSEMLLKHPTLGGGGGNGRLVSCVSPDLSFKNAKERCGCPCSSDAAIVSCSMLVILLSSKHFYCLLFCMFTTFSISLQLLPLYCHHY